MGKQKKEEYKKVLIIDDDLAIRFVLKKLFSKYLSGKGVKIYTSSEGVQGLGYAYLVKPEVILIDSTLPKYSGRELVDYLITNKNFSDIPVIILNEGEKKSEALPSNYSELNKGDKNFPENLLRMVVSKIDREEEKKTERRLNFKVMSFLSEKIIKHSNVSDIGAGKASGLQSKNVFKKVINTIIYILSQIVTSFYLSMFYLLIGKEDREESIEQKKKDLEGFRTRVYPAIAVSIATIIVIVLSIVLVTGTVIGAALLGRRAAHAAVAYTWSGGGTDETCGGALGDGNKWSCVLNWTPNGNPTATDTITFNGTSVKDVNVDSGFTGAVSTITIAAGYSGTITLQRSLQTTSTFTTSAGIFDAKDQVLDVDGGFTINAGAIFRASSGTMYFASSTAFNGGTFDKTTNSGGTVEFDGAGAAVIECASVTFNRVTFNATNTKTVNANCNLPLGNNPSLTITTLTLNGTLSGTNTLTITGNLTLNAATATLNGFSGLSVGSLFKLQNGGISNLGGYSSTVFNSVTLETTANSLTLPSGADLNGALTISGGTFNAPAGTMTIAGALTISGTPTFNANGGTITFDGTGAGAINCNNVAVTFNAVRFQHTSGTKTVSGGCNLPLSNNAITGSVTLTESTLTGGGTLTTAGTFTLNAGGILTGFTGFSASTFTVAGATANFGGYLSFSTSSTATLSSGSLTLPSGADLNATLQIVGGTFDAPSGTMSIAGNLIIVGTPTFHANGGTIIFDSTTVASIDCNSVVVSFHAVSFQHTTGVKTVTGGCNLPLSNNTITGPVTLTGATLTGNGTITQTGTLVLNAGGVLSGFDGFSGAAFTVAGATANLGGYTTFSASGTVTLSSGILTLPSGADLNGALTISGGTFTAPSGTMTLAGDLTISGTPTFNANGGTIIFDAVNTSLSCNNVSFSHIVVSVSGTGIISSNCSLPLGNNPSIGTNVASVISLRGSISGGGLLTSPGLLSLTSTGTLIGFNGLHAYRLDVNGATLDFSNYSPVTIDGGFSLYSNGTYIAPALMTVGGYFSHTDGTFNHNNGTVILNAATLINGDNTFNNLSRTTTGADTLTFISGSTQTILGTLTLKGTKNSQLKLRSSTPGTPWKINPQGTVNIQYLDVQDSNNIGTNYIQAGELGIKDSGNNTGWNFNSPIISNLGPESVIRAGYIPINKPEFTFNITDSDTTQRVKYRIQIADNSAFTDPLIDHTSALGSQGAKSYTVGQEKGTGTYTAGSTNTVLLNTSYSWRVMALDDTGGSSAWVKGGSENAASFRVDTQAPTGGVELVLNTTTTEENKDIYIFSTANDNFSGVESMRVSEDSKFKEAEWEEYKTTKEKTFTTEGEKKIYIQFRDKAGNESEVYTGSITILKKGEEPGKGGEGSQTIAILFLDSNNNPIKGMEVEITELGLRVITNEEGYAIFKDIPTGEYKIKGEYKDSTFEHNLTVSSTDRVSTVILKTQPDYVLYIIIVLLILAFAGFAFYTYRKRKTLDSGG